VESGSAAEAAGLQAGDCVLEVNGEDVLGQRIGEVASRVRARADRVTLLLWNAGSDPHCSPEVSYNWIKFCGSLHFMRVTDPTHLNDNDFNIVAIESTNYEVLYHVNIVKRLSAYRHLQIVTTNNYDSLTDLHTTTITVTTSYMSSQSSLAVAW
jgi:hypothetical protein